VVTVSGDRGEVVAAVTVATVTGCSGDVLTDVVTSGDSGVKSNTFFEETAPLSGHQRKQDKPENLRKNECLG
jgi:hypothetical protein